jgi:4-amino-4-deoxy-L-arabinose transferase-like glycosyltransferase
MAIVGVVFALRAALASAFPLTADEGYYWLWSRHLALTYVDHPPLIAVINAALQVVYPEPLVAVRAGGIIFTALIFWAVYRLSTLVACGGPDVHWRNLALFATLPYSLLILLAFTVDHPLILFYTCALGCTIRYMQRGRDRDVIWAGVFAGLGLLTKYTMGLFYLAVAAFLIASPSHRGILRRPAVWVAAAIGPLMFFPVASADLATGGASWRFHAGRVGQLAWFEGTLAFLGDVTLYLSPFAIYAAARWLRRAKPWKAASPAAALAFHAAWIPFASVLLLSARTRVFPHWPAPAFAPLAVSIGAWMSAAPGQRRALSTFLWGLFGVNVMLIAGVAFVEPAVVRHAAAYRANYELAAKAAVLLREAPRTRFVSDFHGTAAQLSYYARVDATMPTGVLAPPGLPPWGARQFDRWNVEELRAGDNVVLHTLPRRGVLRLAREYFAAVEPLPEWRMAIMEVHLQEMRFYLARGFKLPRAKI